MSKTLAGAPPGACALSPPAAHALVREVLQGLARAAESGAFVTAMRIKGPTLDALARFLSAAQAHCLRVHSQEPVVLIKAPVSDLRARWGTLAPAAA